MNRYKCIIIHLFVCGILLLMHFLEITCPIRYFLKIPCPTCGTTRALLALFRLDWAGYCSYNIMALPVTFVVVLFIHYKGLRNNRIFLVLTYVVLGINMIRYLRILIE